MLSVVGSRRCVLSREVGSGILSREVEEYCL